MVLLCYCFIVLLFYCFIVLLSWSGVQNYLRFFGGQLQVNVYSPSCPDPFPAARHWFTQGQTIVVESWQSSPTLIIFQAKVKETGKVVISNASFEMEAPQICHFWVFWKFGRNRKGILIFLEVLANFIR